MKGVSLSGYQHFVEEIFAELTMHSGFLDGIFMQSS